MRTPAVEDYLKTIYEIEHDQGRVATTALAERLRVTPASVTGMIKKLADMHLVAYEPYQGVILTEAGRKIALEVIRHHRLIELYLAEALGVPWDRVHEEADKWEHILSEDLEDRIDALLGYPTLDPHGAPIPTREGEMASSPRERLADLQPAQRALIAEVSDHDAVLLRELGACGIYPGTQVEILARGGETMTLRLGEMIHAIPLEMAIFVFVQDVRPVDR